MLIEEMGKSSAGAAQKMAETWVGKLSMLSDAWSRFAKKVMDSGPFKFLKLRLQGVLDQLERMGMTGELDALAETLGGKLKDGLEKAWEAAKKLWDLAQRLGAAADWLQDKLGGWDNLCIALALLMAGPLVASLISVTVAVWGLGAALLTTLVGWILLAIAAVIALAYAIYKNWDAIADVLAGWWDDVKARWAAGIAFQGNVCSAIGEAFSGLGQAAGKIWDGLVSSFGAMSGKLGAAAGQIWDGLIAAMGKIWSALSGATGKIGGALASLAGTLAAKGKAMFSALWDAAGTAWDAGVAWLSGVAGRIADSLGTLPGAFAAVGAAMFRTLFNAPAKIAGMLGSLSGPLAAKGGEMIKTLWTAAGTAWDAGVAWLSGAAVTIADYFSGIDLTGIGAGIMSSLWEGLKSIWGDIAAWFGGVADKISNFVSDWTPDALKSQAPAAGSGSVQAGQPAQTGNPDQAPAPGSGRTTGAGDVSGDPGRAAQNTGAPTDARRSIMAPPTGAADVIPRAAAAAHGQPAQEQKVVTEVRIKADNLPPGMRVTTPNSQADHTSINQGFSMQGAG
jgi:hypothetical protein